jgi:hypothetical protein
MIICPEDGFMVENQSAPFDPDIIDELTDISIPATSIEEVVSIDDALYRVKEEA